MRIEEIKDEAGGSEKEETIGYTRRNNDVVAILDAKRALVGAGARALFYPTLLYNVLRNKFQSDFRWWDRVDEFVLLGAVPFPGDVPCLKELGVSGVVTLNEPYEMLVKTSLYHMYEIDHLVIPTTDYLFAPSFADICRAVDFIHGNASQGKTTYVHCKAGRGRSTTVVLCYLVEHRKMTPEAAYQYVRGIRPRVLLSSSQWQAVQEYYIRKLKRPQSNICEKESTVKSLDFNDGSLVVVTELDLEGYDADFDSVLVGNNDSLTELNLACRVQFASQAVIARLSCFLLHGRKYSRMPDTDRLSSIGVEIQVC